jgi:hypothetical protein
MPVDGRKKTEAASASLLGLLATCAQGNQHWGSRRGAPSGITDLTYVQQNSCSSLPLFVLSTY